MTLNQRQRRRFGTRDLAKRWRDAGQTVNKRAHAKLHQARVMVYSSTKTLSTAAGTNMTAPFAGGITAVRISVATAPSSTMSANLLINGVAAATATLASGSTTGYRAFPSILHFAQDDTIAWQITATGSAGGPMIAQMYFYAD